jgi:hypothetical protein
MYNNYQRAEKRLSVNYTNAEIKEAAKNLNNKWTVENENGVKCQLKTMLPMTPMFTVVVYQHGQRVNGGSYEKRIDFVLDCIKKGTYKIA